MEHTKRPTAGQLATYVFFRIGKSLYNHFGILPPMVRRYYTNKGRELQRELNKVHNTFNIRYGKYLEPVNY